MTRGKILAIFQSGGEFSVSSDGTMTYSGGEAHAVDIDREMTLNDIKSEISNIFNCKDTFSIKYFLPSNRRTLITVSCDKDVQRMVDFHADSATTDVYMIKKVENRISRSVVADSGTPTDANNAMVVANDSKRLKISTDWDGLITGVGQVFDGGKEFRDALHKYAIANSFMYRFIRNDGSRITAECTADDCQWRIHASRSRSPGNQDFTIKKMRTSHTCERKLSNEGHRLASQRWVASVIKDKLRDSPDYKPREIANDLHREYGLSLNYSQAWRGKFVAKKELHNSHEEACSQLPWFCERIMETNPGSVATLLTSEDSSFRLFVAFHASLGGFEHGCRPLLFLDGITLKANKLWRVMAATAVDGENEIFPVAFSIVDAETSDNWNWFLQQLKSALSMSRAITFISDWKNGLDEEVPRVFEDSFHGYSVNHLVEDFKLELDEAWTQELKETMLEDFQRSIYACKVDEFNECIESIKSESKELAEWVLDSKPERWSNACFKGLRHGHYSSAAAETFNNWISTRHEPSVVQMVDMIRCKIMEMIYTRRESSNGWAETLVPSVNRTMQEEIIRARTLNVICSTGSVFEVQDDSINVVNVETWECTCRSWQVTGLPCMHALSVFERTTECIFYEYCSKYFTTECYRLTYSLSINPIPDAGRLGSGDQVQSPATCPPRTRRLAGRPKIKPADPLITVKRTVRCSKCKTYGHNKQSCKALV